MYILVAHTASWREPNICSRGCSQGDNDHVDIASVRSRDGGDKSNVQYYSMSTIAPRQRCSNGINTEKKNCSSSPVLELGAKYTCTLVLNARWRCCLQGCQHNQAHRLIATLRWWQHLGCGASVIVPDVLANVLQLEQIGDDWCMLPERCQVQSRVPVVIGDIHVDREIRCQKFRNFRET